VRDVHSATAFPNGSRFWAARRRGGAAAQPHRAFEVLDNMRRLLSFYGIPVRVMGWGVTPFPLGSIDPSERRRLLPPFACFAVASRHGRRPFAGLGRVRAR
jgi:hypothetical protein